MVETSSLGRFQFSVEKAYTVRYSTPIFLQYVAILRKFSELTDDYIKELDGICAKKEKELTEI